MSIKRVRHFSQSLKKVYICDKEQDKDEIKNADFGDEVIVLETDKKYTMDSNKVWR